MTSRVENINTDILQQCREQIGLALFEVEKRIKKIAKIFNISYSSVSKQVKQYKYKVEFRN